MVPHSLQHNTTTRSSARAAAPSATVMGGIACGAATVGDEPREQAFCSSSFLRGRGRIAASSLFAAAQRPSSAQEGLS